MALKYVQVNTLFQAGSGNIIGATSIVLTSLTDIYANVLTMADFGVKGYITLEPDTTNEEAASFTSVVANANGTYTLGGISTILAKSPYTETSGLVRAHSGGTKMVVTDNVGFWNTFANKANDETLTGRWGTAVVPVSGPDLANKTYVDGVAVAGAPNADTTTKGISQKATQAQSQAATDLGSTGASLFLPNSAYGARFFSGYAADAGASDTYVITLSPVPTAYFTGQIVEFKANTANTGACSLNVNGLGAIAIKLNGADPQDNTISAGAYLMVQYDGTNFNIIGNSSMIGTTASKVIQLDASAKLPAVDGSQLTNIGVDYQVFTANGTWTKPVGTTASSTVLVECWAGGGGGGGAGTGSNGSGSGGGGAYLSKLFQASSLTSTIAITIGAGGTAGNSSGSDGGVGGNTTFGSYLTAYGGGGGKGATGGTTGAGGGGGGALGAGSTGASATVGGNGGSPAGAAGAATAGASNDGFGGAAGGGNNGNATAGGLSAYGGGGGTAGGNTTPAGGNAIYGGAGGGITGGTSVFGGNGGSTGVGSVPGGGGSTPGANQTSVAGFAGAGGKCNVITQR